MAGSEVATEAGESRSHLRLEVGSRSAGAHGGVQDPLAGERKRAERQEEQREEEVAVARFCCCILNRKTSTQLPLHTVHVCLYLPYYVYMFLL